MRKARRRRPSAIANSAALEVITSRSGERVPPSLHRCHRSGEGRLTEWAGMMAQEVVPSPRVREDQGQDRHWDWLGWLWGLQ